VGAFQGLADNCVSHGEQHSTLAGAHESSCNHRSEARLRNLLGFMRSRKVEKLSDGRIGYVYYTIHRPERAK